MFQVETMLKPFLKGVGYHLHKPFPFTGTWGCESMKLVPHATCKEIELGIPVIKNVQLHNRLAE